jgi:hydroxyacylglutathione hydrolase
MGSSDCSNDLKDGDRLALGAMEVEVIAAPCHSPDSVCLCLLESGVPVALFSGDTLFAGDVGRPDLRDREIGSHELAAMLHHSLFDKLLKLPPEVKFTRHTAPDRCAGERFRPRRSPRSARKRPPTGRSPAA